jgi:hypothetical protein
MADFYVMVTMERRSTLKRCFWVILITITVLICGCAIKVKDIKQSHIEAKITNYGLFEAEGLSTKMRHPNEEVYLTQYNYLSIKKTTDIIPLKKDTSFGFVWAASGFITNQDQLVIYRIEHPPMILPSGVTSTISNIKYILNTTDGKFEDKLCYGLEEEFEMVPGKWILSVIYNDKVIVSKSFTIQVVNP